MLEEIKISPCQTYHIRNNKPLYQKRFDEVLKFHAPLIAPVKDNTGAYHIDIEGEAIYQQRYNRTFGFYCNIAAVESKNGAFHILPSGLELYPEKYSWCGNYQENICAVRDFNNRFFHINEYGELLYEKKYCYVGDFKDGIAVIWADNGMCTHIDIHGTYIHNKWYKDLDVFHKGFARARDDSGWLHIDRQGNQIYQSRFKHIEPFYNGKALVESYDDSTNIIDEKGSLVHIIRPQAEKANALSSDMVGHWKLGVINAAIKLGIIDLLPNTLENISEKLTIDITILKRVLRALWEIDIVEPEKNKWSLTTKGLLLYPTSESFMACAADMWEQNSYIWPNLLSLLQNSYNQHHSSFKENIKEDEKKILYNKVLDGYNEIEADDVFRAFPWRDSEKITFLGRCSWPVICRVAKTNTYNYINLFGNQNELLDIEKLCSSEKKCNPRSFDYLSLPWEAPSEIICFTRVMHNYPDEDVELLLRAAKENLTGNGVILILEMIASEIKPNGSLLDINQYVESGGQVRTLDHWGKLSVSNKLIISKCTSISNSLSMLELTNG